MKAQVAGMFNRLNARFRELEKEHSYKDQVPALINAVNAIRRGNYHPEAVKTVEQMFNLKIKVSRNKLEIL